MKTILFDGQCLLCNGFIGFVLQRCHPDLFRCDLHSSKGQEMLRQHELPTQQVTTIYFLEDGHLFSKSTAVLRIIKNLGPFYNVAATAAGLIPALLRDTVYSWVAKNRHRLRKKESCLFPDALQRKQILTELACIW